MSEMIEVARSSVQTWECDQMGHMNVQFYVARASDAAFYLRHALGLSPSRVRAEGRAMIALEEHIRLAETRERDGTRRAPTTLEGFERLSQTAGSARVRKLGPCGGVMDEAWFDGLNLGVRDVSDQRCDMNPALPEAVKSQLEGNVQIPWVALFHIVPDPRSDLLIMRGKSWGGQVHYDQFSLKVSRQSGPVPYAAPEGQRALNDEDTLLSSSAMGADDDEAR